MSRKAVSSAGTAAACFSSTTLLHHSPQNGGHTRGDGLARLDVAAAGGERGRDRQCRQWRPRLPGEPLPPLPPPKSPPCTRTAVPCRQASLGMHCARMYCMICEHACNLCIVVRMHTCMLTQHYECRSAKNARFAHRRYSQHPVNPLRGERFIDRQVLICGSSL